MTDKVKSIRFGHVTLTLVADKNGYSDFDVAGHPQGIYRVTIGSDLNIGDLFNVYYNESSKTAIEWLGDIELSLHDRCLDKHGLRPEMRAKIVAENQASKKLSEIFLAFERSKGIRLVPHYSTLSKKKVLIEGYEPHAWKTTLFKNTFESCVEMKKYFHEFVGGEIKTYNAHRVLALMDSVEDGGSRYSEFVKTVSQEEGVSVEQLEKELEPFV